jgi:alpha-beta hydrolase superfamily lysophospholipase
LGRFTTLRSWLSQWSLKSNACSLKVGNRIRLPVLVVGNTADDACTPSHTRRLFDCVENATSRALHEVKGATHYYAFQPEHLRQAAGIVTDWLGRQAF